MTTLEMDDKDYQITVALLKEVLKDQINQSTTGVTANVDLNTLNLPETTVTDEQSKKVLAELAKTVQLIGNKLDQEHELNDLINSFAPIASKESFTEIMESIFVEGQINWRRIIVLFYVAGKLSVKMILNNLPRVVRKVVNWCLDYFKSKLLGWIHRMGGWHSRDFSISGLAQFSLEEFSSSSLCRISPSCVVLTFMAGVLIGGLIVWKMKKNS